VFEGFTQFDDNGNYVTNVVGPTGYQDGFSNWYSSAGIYRVRIVMDTGSLNTTLSQVSLDEAFFEQAANPYPMRSQLVPIVSYPQPLFAEFDITATFFQINIAGGEANANTGVFMVVRAVQ
jgi:hypothetical protein